MRKLPYMLHLESVVACKIGEQEGWFWRVGMMESGLESLLEHVFLVYFLNLVIKSHVVSEIDGINIENITSVILYL